jgi:hypothetical protein
MVVYFHTATAIFAVANGICSQVMDADGRVIEDHPLRLHKLMGGVADAFAKTEQKVDETGVVSGLRLQFDFRAATLTTEPVLHIEEAPSLSFRPQLRSVAATVETGGGVNLRPGLRPAASDMFTPAARSSTPQE